MTTTKELNKSVLTKIAYKNDTAEAVLTTCALRERARPQMDLRRLKAQLVQEGFKIVPQEFIETFRELHRAGIGEFVNRPGEPPKFKWHFNLKEVGQLAIDNPQKPVPAPKPVAVTKPVTEDAPTTVILVLSPSRTAKLELPSGLSREELGLISQIIGDQCRG